MSTLQEYVLVIGSFQGCLLAALLLLDTRLNVASRLLGLLCLMMASVLCLPFLLLSPQGAWSWVIGWLFYLPAAGGALAFLYCRSALLDQPPDARDLVLFTPWLACYALTADVFLFEPEHMVMWIDGAAGRTWRLQASEYLLFAQAFAFAGLTVAMIWRYRRQANDTLANFNPSIFRWMLTLQVFTIAIWTLKAMPALTSAPVALSDAGNVLMLVLIYFIAVTQWRHPHLLTIPNLAKERATQAAGASLDASASDSGALDATMRKQLFDEIRGAVERRKLYLDSQLTLSSLADAVGLSRHQVSEALNRHAGKNFYEFINGYRIASVCRRLAQDDTARILDIALDGGFSSKSTFNAIFKQFTGQTPTQYRRALKRKAG